MIEKVLITNPSGATLELELARPELSGFAVLSIDGLGPPTGAINLTDLGGTDGSAFNSARANKRNIVLNLRFISDDARRESYKYFPVKRNVKIAVVSNDRTVETEGYVEYNNPNIFSPESGCSISIICPDPYLYDSSLQTAIIAGVSKEFTFPFMNNSLTENLIIFGEYRDNAGVNIEYEGNDDAGINIVVHFSGDVTDLRIYNSLTREILQIDTSLVPGGKFIHGDGLVISTIRGNKFITLTRDGIDYNLMNALGRNPVWIRLIPGSNVFSYAVTSGDSNMIMRVEYKIKYEGV